MKSVWYFYLLQLKEYFKDIKVAQDPPALFWIVLVLIALIFVNILIWYMLDYLQNKPLGSQTLLDVGHQHLLWTLSSLSVIITCGSLSTVLLQDLGHVLAYVSSWPIYLSICALVFSLCLNSVIQFILVLNPQCLETAPSDKHVKVAMILATILILVAITATIMYFGEKPEAYYILRHIKHGDQEAKVAGKLRKVWSRSCMLLFVIMKVCVWLKFKLKCRQSSNNFSLSIDNTWLPARNKNMLSGDAFLLIISLWIALNEARLNYELPSNVIAMVGTYGTILIIGVLHIMVNETFRHQIKRTFYNCLPHWLTYPRTNIVSVNP